jgi:hypothetical protein
VKKSGGIFMIRDQRPNFKVESTEAKITPCAGLVLVERMAQALDVPELLDFRLGYLKRRNRGYRVCDKVMDLVRLSVAGGSALSDIRSLRDDEVVKGFLGREKLMSCSTAVEFLSQLGASEVEDLSDVCGKAATDTLRLNKNKVATLDVDATFIEAHKREAKYSFHKEPGYYPMLGFVAETKQLLLAEFKDGNASPSSGALGFLKQLVSRLPDTIVKKRLRSDSAWFNIDVMDHCADNNIEFAITADKNQHMYQVIEAIAKDQWEVFQDDPEEQIAESVYSFNRGKYAYRIIILRRPMSQLDMFKGIWEYRVVITNMEWGKRRLIMWHRERANSENFIKELKSGFALEHLPSGRFYSNAAYLQIVGLAYNLICALKTLSLPASFHSYTIKTLRFHLIHIAGLWIRHARRWVLKLSAPEHLIALFKSTLAQPVPLRT